MLPNAARIQNVNLARARALINGLRRSAAPANVPTRREVADALDAIVDLIAPFDAPRLDDADTLLSDMQHNPSAAENLATAAAVWTEGA